MSKTYIRQKKRIMQYCGSIKFCFSEVKYLKTILFYVFSILRILDQKLIFCLYLLLLDSPLVNTGKIYLKLQNNVSAKDSSKKELCNSIERIDTQVWLLGTQFSDYAITEAKNSSMYFWIIKLKSSNSSKSELWQELLKID